MRETKTFRCINSTSSKWWSYEKTDRTITTTWGKVVNKKNEWKDTNFSVQSYASNQDCSKFLERLVRTKLNKGYMEYKDDSVSPVSKKEEVKQNLLALDLW